VWGGGGGPARAQYHGRGVEPQRVPTAPGAQGQAPKKIVETDAIFAKLRAQDQAAQDGRVLRVSMDCQATVNIGDYSRGDTQAADHDMGCQEKYTPFGVVDEDSGALHVTFGASAKISDFIVDSLSVWWQQQPAECRDAVARLQIKADNGPESNGWRTQFLKRMVEFADHIGKPIRLLYYPPYHSKYNPIERCWGMLEKHWNGTQLVDAQTLLEWTKGMTWEGLHPLVEVNRKVYEKGISLSKATMQAVEARLKRNSDLAKWDILIKPACVV
jgi:hypothetical protein